MTQVASQMLPFVIFGGFIFHMTGLITLGIYCYLILLAFQLITLPVEFDASRRAKIILQQMGIVQPGEEVVGVNKVLNAAALTYVAAFIATLGNLLWLHVGARPPLMPPGDPKKMNPAIALPSPRRFSDLLSSGLRSRAKPKRDAMEQPRSDEDKQLVARTQSGRRAARLTSWSSNTRRVFTAWSTT